MFILFWTFFLPTRLIEPTRLFNFGNCSYLHVISNCALIKEVRVCISYFQEIMLILLMFRNKLVISSPSIIFMSILICMRCLDKFFIFHSRWFFKKDIPHAWLNSFLGVHARNLLKFGIKELERIEIRGGLGHSSPALHTVIQSIQYNASKVVKFSVTYLLKVS